MNNRQIELVRTSFAAVEPIAEQAAALFYGRLFEIAPEVRALFPDDLTDQGRKLMQMLASVVRNLDNLDVVVPVAQRLGERHVGYGAEAAHYGPVGAALLWTLGQGLGDAFTPEVEESWTAAYTVLSGVMIDAAAAAEVPA